MASSPPRRCWSPPPITMTAATTDVAAGRIAARYTGTTTCEGPITAGSLTVVR